MLLDPELLSKVLIELQSKRTPVKGTEIIGRIPGMTSEDIYSLLAKGILTASTSGSEIREHKFWINSTNPIKVDDPILREKRDTVSVVATLPFKELSSLPDLKSLHAELCRLIINSTGEIAIVNPFFDRVGREQLILYLRGALDRGVTVRIICRGLGTTQVRSFVSPLLANAGTDVQVRLLPKGKESSVHGKLLIADSASAYVGSANLTGRSLVSNLEFGVILGGKPVKTFRLIFDKLWELSHSIGLTGHS